MGIISVLQSSMMPIHPFTCSGNVFLFPDTYSLFRADMLLVRNEYGNMLESNLDI